MVRNAVLGDVEAIKLIKPIITDKTIQERLDKQANGEVEFLVLENNGRLVCFGLLKWHGKSSPPEYPDMEDLYTMESERGKGYGSQLIVEMEMRALKKGCKKIGLAVNPTLNPRAKRLYERLGYVETGEPAYLDGVYNGTEDWVIDMEKNLI